MDEQASPWAAEALTVLDYLSIYRHDPLALARALPLRLPDVAAPAVSAREFVGALSVSVFILAFKEKFGCPLTGAQTVRSAKQGIGSRNAKILALRSETARPNPLGGVG